MPNGGSWDRFWFVLVGYRVQFGEWPTQLTIPDVVQEALSAHLSQSDLDKIRSKLDLVEGMELIARDSAGREYRYQGPPERRPDADPQVWLGVRWE